MDVCKDLLNQLGQLSLAHKSAITSNSPEPDYVVDLSVPNNDDDSQIAAASSNFTIHLMSRHSLQTLNTIKGHKSTITKVQFSKNDPHVLFSSSRDKSLRCWDVRTAKEVQSFDVPAKLKVELLSMDVNQSGRLVCAGTDRVDSDSYLLFWDSRQKSVLGCYSECHQDDITQLSFQPGSDRKLASGASDGLVCTFDLQEASEDDSLQTTVNVESAVDVLGWCGNKSECIYAVTCDCSLHMSDSEQGEDLLAIHSLQDICSSEDTKANYILGCVPELTAIDKTRSSVVLLTASHSGELEMLRYTREDDSCRKVCQLHGGHSATLRCSHWDHQTNTLLTGAEDSLVCLWSVGQALSSRPGAKHVQGKVKTKASISKSSKKPYDRSKR